MSIQLSVYPPLPTLDETIQKYVKKIDAVVSNRLLKGFDWQPPASALSDETLALFNGEVPTFRFSTKMSDQMNITQAALLATQSAMTGGTDWKRSWQGWFNNTQYTLMFDLQSWAGFVDAYGKMKDNTLGQGWIWKAQLRKQVTPEAVEAIFKTFGLTEAEIQEAESSVDATLQQLTRFIHRLPISKIAMLIILVGCGICRIPLVVSILNYHYGDHRVTGTDGVMTGSASRNEITYGNGVSGLFTWCNGLDIPDLINGRQWWDSLGTRVKRIIIIGIMKMVVL